MLEAAQEHLPVADGGRGVALLAQFVLRDAVERRAGPDHVDLAVVVDEVDQPLDQHRRGVVPAQLLLPEHLAGGRFVAEGHARAVDAEQVDRPRRGARGCRAPPCCRARRRGFCVTLPRPSGRMARMCRSRPTAADEHAARPFRCRPAWPRTPPTGRPPSRAACPCRDRSWSRSGRRTGPTACGRPSRG